MSDKHLAKSGAFWLGCERASTLLVVFLSSIILARLLGPADFGAVALSMAVARLSLRLASIGLGPEVMRLKEDAPDYHVRLSTYFWLNVAIVLFVGALSVGCVSMVSFLKGEKFVIFVVIILGWSFNNFCSPFRSLLLKHMRFRTIFFLDFFPAFATALFAIGMALQGYGKWALVIPQITFLCLSAFMAANLSGFRPGLFFHPAWALYLLKKSPWYVVTNFTEEGVERVDDIFLGKMLGSTILGYYERAYTTAILFHKNIGTMINRLLMPFFYKHVGNQSGLEVIYAFTVKIIIYVIGIPLLFFLWFCPEIIGFVYGSKWLPAVPVFYAISVYILCLPLYHINKNFSLSQDDVAQTGQISMEIFTVLIILLFPLIRFWGAVGAALAMDGAMFYGLTRMIFLARRRCRIDLFRTYLRPVGLGIGGLAMGWGLKLWLYPLWGIAGVLPVNLVVVGGLGAVIYFCEQELVKFFYPAIKKGRT